MIVVVNHLHFRKPVGEATVAVLHDAARTCVEAGALAVRVVRVDDTHHMLLLDFRSPEDAAHVAQEVGGPFMEEHILPLLAGDTDRSIGRVIVSARA